MLGGVERMERFPPLLGQELTVTGAGKIESYSNIIVPVQYTEYSISHVPVIGIILLNMRFLAI